MSVVLFLVFALGQGEACVETRPISTNERAPCSGILWPVEFTAGALNVMQVEFPKCQAKLEAAQDELGICNKTITDIREECDETLNRFAALTKKAARIERPWWDNNPFWGGAGFVSGVIITVLIVSSAR